MSLLSSLKSLPSKITAWFKDIPRKVIVWLTCKAVMWGYQKVTAAHLGSKLNELMDKKFGKEKSDPAQKDIAALLEGWAKELRA